MDIIEQFLRKISYKFPKGYPDVDDPKDWLMLEGILKKMGAELEEAKLTGAELKKDATIGGKKVPRIDILIKKITNNEPLELDKGGTFLVDNKEEVITQLKSKNIPRNGIELIDVKGNKISTNSLKKTEEFGGKASGFSTRGEDEALANINQKLKEMGAVDIVLSPGGKVYKGINGATTFKGTHKADFSLNTDGTPKIFISHKVGTSAKAFQQYGGFTGLYSYPEVAKFTEDVKEITGGKMEPGGPSYRRKVNSEEVIRKAVYGLDFGASSYGIDNVQIVIQGDLELQPLNDGTFLLKGFHTILTPEPPTGNGYDSYFYALYRGDRNNGGIKTCRLFVAPEVLRSTAQEI